jgi:hypothetical protein
MGKQAILTRPTRTLHEQRNSDTGRKRKVTHFSLFLHFFPTSAPFGNIATALAVIE